jgi:hypothetical protein
VTGQAAIVPIIIMPPHAIIMGMPAFTMSVIRLQNSMNMSLDMPSIGIISQTIPAAVILQVILPIIIGMGIIPDIIGIMPFIMGIMPFIIIGFIMPIMGIIPFIMLLIIGMPPIIMGMAGICIAALIVFLPSPRRRTRVRRCWA